MRLPTWTLGEVHPNHLLAVRRPRTRVHQRALSLSAFPWALCFHRNHVDQHMRTASFLRVPENASSQKQVPHVVATPTKLHRQKERESVGSRVVTFRQIHVKFWIGIPIGFVPCLSRKSTSGFNTLRQKDFAARTSAPSANSIVFSMMTYRWFPRNLDTNKEPPPRISMSAP